jgi:hypothetical protein
MTRTSLPLRGAVAAVHESAVGPMRRFAAARHDACNGVESGLSVDVAQTAAS